MLFSKVNQVNSRNSSFSTGWFITLQLWWFIQELTPEAFASLMFGKIIGRKSQKQRNKDDSISKQIDKHRVIFKDLKSKRESHWIAKSVHSKFCYLSLAIPFKTCKQVWCFWFSLHSCQNQLVYIKCWPNTWAIHFWAEKLL